jgi:hypothetical protein
MHKILKSTFLLLLIGVFAFQCNIVSAKSKRKPKWVTNRPIDGNYYIGIGKSSKTQADYIQLAKNTALADMISEISVNISSNSILYKFEDNLGYKEKYEATIKTSVKDHIQDYEIVASWENKDEYWVYYRLSKAEYKSLKREKLEKAKSLSKDFYEKAKLYEKEYDINNALIFYIKSFDAIINHLGEDLSVFTFDGRIYLDNAVFQSIQDIFSRMRFVSEKESYELKALSSGNKQVIFKAKLRTDLETENLSNIPIIFSFPTIDMLPEQVVTIDNGKAECTIAGTVPKGRTHILRAELNVDNYFGPDSNDNLLKNLLLERGTKPFGNTNIVVKELFAYLESQEILFGTESSLNKLMPVFKNELSENFFSFTNDLEKADVLVKINTEIIKGTKLDKHNLHTAFLNCNISIKNLETDLVIFTDGFDNLKGIKSGSFESASMDAIIKAENKIRNKIVPNIRKLKL